METILNNLFNETERLNALEDYQIMDTDPEDDFDELTTLASKICGTPIALITLLDENRQWFKSKVGLTTTQTPREHAFCAHTIMEEDGIMEVHDARVDERFFANPLVTSSPDIVFYAGISLKNPQGLPMGSLCVIDQIPRKLSGEQLEALSIIAKQVIAQMELRSKIRKLSEANRQLAESNRFMQRFATNAAHDLKNPLSSISISSQLMVRELSASADLKLFKLASANFSSAKKLVRMIDDMLDYSLRPEALINSRKKIDLLELLNKTISMISIPDNVIINLPRENFFFLTSEIALQQIFINLLTNAIRYNDKSQCLINISFTLVADALSFTIEDNGPGIAQDQLKRIFERDVILTQQDRFSQKGTGIGLHTVSVLIEKLNGEISVYSELGKGTGFIFTFRE